MNLTGETREAIQVAVLQSLQAVHPMRLTTAQLLTPVKLATGQAALPETTLHSLLHDMSEGTEPLVNGQASPLNRALLKWQRTDHGRALLETSGLLH
ncbi:MAG: hypothetical protein V4662_11990 [Verrucomicrobiota bacterium]